MPILERCQITNLLLENNQLTALPESFGNLSKLQYLYLGGNQLTALPESFGNLSKLSALHLYRNQLETLPESFGNLSKLQYLYLGGNQLTALPENFGELNSLRSLDLSKNQLSELPRSFGDLRELEIIDLSKNHNLMTLPESFGNLQKLTELYLSNNKLTTLPDTFRHLHNLFILKLNGNQFTEIPQILSEMTIYDKDLKDNPLPITTMDEAWETLKTFSNLLDGNLLHDIRRSFDSMLRGLAYQTPGVLKLDNLGITNTDLEVLVPFLKRCQITGVNLSSNQLTALPESFGNLSNLRSLWLWNNQLTRLPESLGQLNLLEQLVVSENRNLTEIPQSVWNLQLPIDLRNTPLAPFTNTNQAFYKLENLDFPEDLVNRVKEQLYAGGGWINLSNLEIEPIELETLIPFLRRCYITSLNLSENELATIPENIVQLNSLQTLNLSNNQFDVVPEVLRRMAIPNLQMKGNPLQGQQPVQTTQELLLNMPGIDDADRQCRYFVQ